MRRAVAAGRAQRYTHTHRRRATQYLLRSLKPIKSAIQLRYDYDTTIYDEKLTCSFLLASNRVEWKQARAIRRSRIVVVSQSNGNCNHGLSGGKGIVSKCFCCLKTAEITAYRFRRRCSKYHYNSYDLNLQLPIRCTDNVIKLHACMHILIVWKDFLSFYVNEKSRVEVFLYRIKVVVHRLSTFFYFVDPTNVS